MMPCLPYSIPISNQMSEHLQGKIIADIKCLNFYEGEYKLPTISFDNINQLIDQKIIKSNSNFIFVDNGWLCEFGYDFGFLRFYKDDVQHEVDEGKKLKTGGFIIKFIFKDKSCFYLILNGWTNRFNVRPVEPAIDTILFRNKYPLDVTDKEDFSFSNFKTWLNDKGRWSIIESCVLAKGAFDIKTSLMNYILWISSIHPKTKVSMLNEEEIKKIYDNTVKTINEYKAGIRNCRYVDIFGESMGEDDISITLFTSKNLNRLCPICNAPIDCISGGGTKLYFCPQCQKIKNKSSLDYYITS